MSVTAVRVTLGVFVAVLVSGLVAGCGRDVVVLDEINGSKVGAMAERELEAENPRLAPGAMACPDLDFEVGASVRCVRTTELSGGRIVKVGGTVEVTSLASGGHLHVAMDMEATEFGLAGDRVASDLRRQFLERFHREPSRLTCPYLRGVVGHRVTCRLVDGGTGRDVDVVVTAVDPETYAVRYTTNAHRSAS